MARFKASEHRPLELVQHGGMGGIVGEIGGLSGIALQVVQSMGDTRRRETRRQALGKGARPVAKMYFQRSDLTIALLSMSSSLNT